MLLNKNHWAIMSRHDRRDSLDVLLACTHYPSQFCSLMLTLWITTSWSPIVHHPVLSPFLPSILRSWYSLPSFMSYKCWEGFFVDLCICFMIQISWKLQFETFHCVRIKQKKFTKTCWIVNGQPGFLQKYIMKRSTLPFHLEGIIFGSFFNTMLRRPTYKKY